MLFMIAQLAAGAFAAALTETVEILACFYYGARSIWLTRNSYAVGGREGLSLPVCAKAVWW